MNIPKQAKAVILPAYNANFIRALLGLELREVDLPVMKDDEVMIKIHATTCNPSDIAFMQGGYNIIKPLPAIPGFEGTGEVIAAGDKWQHLTGKKVSVFSQDNHSGCWSEILVTKGENCIVLKDGIDLHQAATLAINPLTAYGMFLEAKQRGSSTIVLNAAGGRVPEFIGKMAVDENMEVINIFRKHKAETDSINFENQKVLYSSDGAFEEKLKELLSDKTNVTAFDAVGGTHSGILFNALPADSLLMVYGGLSNNPVEGIDTLSLIFNNKTIAGFNLNNFIALHRAKGDLTKITDDLQKLIIEGKISTKISTVFPLSDIVKGIRQYIKNMSAGKVIFTP